MHLSGGETTTHMARALIASLAIVLATGVVTLDVPQIGAAQQPSPASLDSQSSPYYDAEAERRLLDMANRERAKAGLPPLQLDDGLAKAARPHGAAMAAQQKTFASAFRRTQPRSPPRGQHEDPA